MDWFQYFCCGNTFSRVVREATMPVVCPRCRRQVKPLVSLHPKDDTLGSHGKP